MNMNKKGFSGPVFALVGGVMALLVLIIVLSVNANVLEDYQDTLTAGDASHNATADGLSAFDKISGFNPTIGLVIVAAAIIMLLMGAIAVTRFR